MRANQWVIIQQPNEAERLVYLKPGTMIDMGRYGKFLADALFNKTSGLYYTVEKDGSLVNLDPAATLSQAPGEGGDNPNDCLHDHNDSQVLSTEQIEEIKDKAVSPQEVVRQVVEGSQSFQRKNAFSQLKYVQRKERKYLRWIRPLEPTTRLLCEHFMAREGSKILDLRLDSLSQLLCLANLQAGCRLLVWDDSRGFVTGALAKRIPAGHCVVLHGAGQPWQPSMLVYHNLTETERERILTFSLGDLPPQAMPPALPFYTGEDRTPEQLELHRQRHEAREARRSLLRSWMEAANFTSGVLVANAQTDIMALLPHFAATLQGSARLVIYCPYRECLLQPFQWLRQAGWVDVQLTDSWLRPYQTAEGRLHPEMSSTSHSGYLLTALLIRK